MATMAMDMVLKIKTALFVILLFPFTSILAGEWLVAPQINIGSTFTDNVNHNPSSKKSSWVTQSKVGLKNEYSAKHAELELNATTTFANFSHNSALNDTFIDLTGAGSLTVWEGGPKIRLNSSIDNKSQNQSSNSLADIVSSDTVQVQSHQLGLEYAINNADINFFSYASYNLTESEDEFGDNEGYTTILKAENSTSSRHVFWQLNSTTNRRENNGLHSVTERHEAKLGWINNSNIIPFIHTSSESASGTITTNTNEITTWGPGLRWKIQPKLILETSYHFVDDEDTSDNYLATSVEWQKNSRTSLMAKHYKRFFGDSYELSFNHRTRRLTNSFSYTDSISSFDRSNSLSLVEYWCPVNEPILDLSQCTVENKANDVNYSSIVITAVNTETTNQFAINKAFSWQSVLTLSRTTFDFNISSNQRDYLDSSQQNESLNANFIITRKISGRSTVTVKSNYRENKVSSFNAISTSTLEQKDYYATLSVNYAKTFGHSLTANIDINYTNRDSTNSLYNYDETRTSFNIRKDF